MRIAIDKSKLAWAPALCFLLAAMIAGVGGRTSVMLGFIAAAALWAGLHASPAGTRRQRTLLLIASACALGVIASTIAGFLR